VSANDIWAVGAYVGEEYSTLRPIVAHWNGTEWSLYYTPLTFGVLYAVSAQSSNDVWVAGAGLISMHWDGSTWSQVRAVTPPNSISGTRDFFGVSGLSLIEAWSVGSYED